MPLTTRNKCTAEHFEGYLAETFLFTPFAYSND